MAEGSAVRLLGDFGEIVKAEEPLAPHSSWRLGGPAEALVRPRSRDELAAVVRRCFEKNVPLRVLGDGCNVLVRDEGVRGVVLRLTEPAFTEVMVEGRRVRAGAGATLAALIATAARHNLGGLETLVGTPGTVGGALRQGAADRSSELLQYATRVEVMESDGNVQQRERDELRFLDEPVLLAAEFELEPEGADALNKRLLKSWIQRKANQPLSFQAAGRVFKNPRGLNAAALIEQAGLAGTKVGGAEVSERDASFVVAHPGATSRDVLRLIDLVRSRVQERFHVELELLITVW
jgi:UDP-N-acetylmuramate dehydrogenase